MSPSSPVSVGMTPSNRTLEVGSAQVDLAPVLLTFEQCPVADDPLTDTVTSLKMKLLDGTTVCIGMIINS